MDLKDGTLKSLIEEADETEIKYIADRALQDMLEALDFLSVKELNHRDVKPENILYKRHSSQITFVLSDFGLSSKKGIIVGFAGTSMYIAPEGFREGMSIDNGDIWSLYITLLEVILPQALIRFQTPDEFHDAAVEQSAKDDLVHLREMARKNPETRATAAQMLIKYFDGAGLSTSRDRVKPIAPASEADDDVGGPATLNWNGFRVESSRAVDEDSPMANISHSTRCAPDSHAEPISGPYIVQSPPERLTESVSAGFETPIGIIDDPAIEDEITSLSVSLAGMSTRNSPEIIPETPRGVFGNETELPFEPATEPADEAGPSTNQNGSNLVSSHAASGDSQSHEEASSGQQPDGEPSNTQTSPGKGQMAMPASTDRGRLQRSRSPPADRYQKRRRLRNPESSSAPVDY